MSTSNKRIIKEIQEFLKDNNMEKNGYTIEQVNNSINHLLGRIRGPPGSPYEIGIYSVDITIPDTYPFSPPKCKFVTKIWHPNVSSVTGAICLDVLKDQWAAAMTIGSLMVSIQTFLSLPEPDDPQDAVVANQYLSNKQLFEQTAKYWSHIYATDDKSKNEKQKEVYSYFDDMVANLMTSKKISRDRAISVLSCNGWDLDQSNKSA